MGVLDGVVIVEGTGQFFWGGVNSGRLIVTNEDFVAYVRERRAVPKLLWGGLVKFKKHARNSLTMI